MDVFISFAKVGVMTFGGGYAMLPMLQREIVENKGWATDEELTDYFAIGQCTPGVIAVNTATFVGKKLYGVPGAIFATLGVIFPSILIIMLIAALIYNFSDIPAVKHIFAGIRVCVCVLILNAVIKLWKKTVVDKATLAIFVCVFLLAVFIDITPVVFVVLAAVAGLVISYFKARGGKTK